MAKAQLKEDYKKFHQEQIIRTAQELQLNLMLAYGECTVTDSAVKDGALVVSDVKQAPLVPDPSISPTKFYFRDKQNRSSFLSGYIKATFETDDSRIKKGFLKYGLGFFDSSILVQPEFSDLVQAAKRLNHEDCLLLLTAPKIQCLHFYAHSFKDHALKIKELPLGEKILHAYVEAQFNAGRIHGDSDWTAVKSVVLQHFPESQELFKDFPLFSSRSSPADIFPADGNSREIAVKINLNSLREHVYIPDWTLRKYEERLQELQDLLMKPPAPFEVLHVVCQKEDFHGAYVKTHLYASVKADSPLDDNLLKELVIAYFTYWQQVLEHKEGHEIEDDQAELLAFFNTFLLDKKLAQKSCPSKKAKL